MAHILGALVAGSAVMFAVVVLRDGPQVAQDGGVVAGPRSDGSATKPSPEIAAAAPDDALRAAWDEERPITWQSEGTATEPSPTETSAREASPIADETTGQAEQWAPGAPPPDWAISLREALAQQAAVNGEPAPTPAAQHLSEADNAEKSDGGLVESLLGRLDGES
ncbi:MAG: hypothetical protein ACRDTG_24220 [Pseudonocardiaceae bacterium]